MVEAEASRRLPVMTAQIEGVPWTITIAAAAIAMLGGFTNGYGASITGGALNRIEADLVVSDIEQSAMESALFVGMVFGCIFGGWIADLCGRRPSTFFGEAIVFLSALAQAAAGTPAQMSVFRVLHGFGLGVCVLIKPLYISELVSPESRGLVIGEPCVVYLRFVTASSVMMSQGFFLGHTQLDSALPWLWMPHCLRQEQCSGDMS